MPNPEHFLKSLPPSSNEKALSENEKPVESKEIDPKGAATQARKVAEVLTQLVPSLRNPEQIGYQNLIRELSPLKKDLENFGQELPAENLPIRVALDNLYSVVNANCELAEIAKKNLSSSAREVVQISKEDSSLIYVLRTTLGLNDDEGVEISKKDFVNIVKDLDPQQMFDCLSFVASRLPIETQEALKEKEKEHLELKHSFLLGQFLEKVDKFKPSSSDKPSIDIVGPWYKGDKKNVAQDIDAIDKLLQSCVEDAFFGPASTDNLTSLSVWGNVLLADSAYQDLNPEEKVFLYKLGFSDPLKSNEENTKQLNSLRKGAKENYVFEAMGGWNTLSTESYNIPRFEKGSEDEYLVPIHKLQQLCYGTFGTEAFFENAGEKVDIKRHLVEAKLNDIVDAFYFEKVSPLVKPSGDIKVDVFGRTHVPETGEVARADYPAMLVESINGTELRCLISWEAIQQEHRSQIYDAFKALKLSYKADFLNEVQTFESVIDNNGNLVFVPKGIGRFDNISNLLVLTDKEEGVSRKECLKKIRKYDFHGVSASVIGQNGYSDVYNHALIDGAGIREHVAAVNLSLVLRNVLSNNALLDSFPSIDVTKAGELERFRLQNAIPFFAQNLKELFEKFNQKDIFEVVQQRQEIVDKVNTDLTTLSLDLNDIEKALLEEQIRLSFNNKNIANSAENSRDSTSIYEYKKEDIKGYIKSLLAGTGITLDPETRDIKFNLAMLNFSKEDEAKFLKVWEEEFKAKASKQLYLFKKLYFTPIEKLDEAKIHALLGNCASVTEAMLNTLIKAFPEKFDIRMKGVHIDESVKQPINSESVINEKTKDKVSYTVKRVEQLDNFDLAPEFFVPGNEIWNLYLKANEASSAGLTTNEFSVMLNAEVILPALANAVLDEWRAKEFEYFKHNYPELSINKFEEVFELIYKASLAEVSNEDAVYNSAINELQKIFSSFGVKKVGAYKDLNHLVEQGALDPNLDEVRASAAFFIHMLKTSPNSFVVAGESRLKVAHGPSYEDSQNMSAEEFKRAISTAAKASQFGAGVTPFNSALGPIDSFAKGVYKSSFAAYVKSIGTVGDVEKMQEINYKTLAELNIAKRVPIEPAGRSNAILYGTKAITTVNLAETGVYFLKVQGAGLSSEISNAQGSSISGMHPAGSSHTPVTISFSSQGLLIKISPTLSPRLTRLFENHLKNNLKNLDTRLMERPKAAFEDLNPFSAYAK